jgi:hypothetical protein
MKNRDKSFNEHFNKHYTIPENYFDRLEETLTHRLRKRNRNTVSLFSKIVSALFLLVILSYPVYQYILQRDHGDGSYEELNLTDVPDDVIEEYLLMETDLTVLENK